MAGELAEGAKARAMLEIVEGDNGLAPGIFALWMEAAVHARVSVRTGVQATVFGSRDFFPIPTRGLYVAGPVFKNIAQAAGVVDKRDLGIRARVDLGDNSHVDLMSTDDRGIARATQELGGGISFLASGQQGTREASAGLSAWSGLLRVDKPNVRAVLEVLGGTPGEAEDSFLAGEAALWLHRDLSGGALDSAALVMRHGVFDPQSATEAGDSWSLTNVAVQLHWPSHPGMHLMTDLGVQLRAEGEAPAETAAMAQVMWIW